MADRGPNRKDPWMKFFVSDFAGDEKLRECSAQATGVFIRLMCLMHISEPYGRVSLSKGYSQGLSTCLDFAKKVSTQLPYELSVINSGIKELLDVGVLYIEGNCLCQKRMIRDFERYSVMSGHGRRGGKATAKAKALAKAKATSKMQASSDSSSSSDSKERKEGVETIENQTLYRDFEDAHRAYPGRTYSVASDFAVLEQRSDWREVIPKLLPAIELQIRWREQANGEFRAPWKDFRNWLDKEGWEEKVKIPEPEKVIL